MGFKEVILLLAALNIFVASAHFVNDAGWQVWKKYHKKTYRDDGEEAVRHVIWQDNLKRIEQHNAAGGVVLRMNHFGDMTNQEFRMTMNGLLKTNGTKSKGSAFMSPSYVKVPENVDWREKGYVTPVKNQGQCGSCYSFSATGALEGQNFKKTGKLISLSEQQIVDCSTAYGDHGCQGGLMDNVFEYIKEAGGLETEEDYPYLAEQQTECDFNKSEIAAKVTGFVDVPEGDEDALRDASATVGPISVAIDASHFSFQFYHSGVYSDPQCSAENLDHGVLLVGYGVYRGGEEPKDYWLIKNSWGPSWGLDGYVRIERNNGNMCGVASKASYPLV